MSQMAATFRSSMPTLRRFGRALTGDQITADLAVLHLMNRIVASDQALTADAGLYARYLQVLREITAVDFEREFSPLAWQCGWLAEADDFSSADIAAALLLSEHQVEKQLDEYRRLVADQAVCSSVLIIEDEFLIALDLKRIVSQMGHRVSYVARNRDDATEAFRREPADLVLSDVFLADGSSGIDAVEDIQSLTRVPAIFITAFPAEFLQGEAGEPVFLITKPFNPRVVRAAVRQALMLAKHKSRSR